MEQERKLNDLQLNFSAACVGCEFTNVDYKSYMLNCYHVLHGKKNEDEPMGPRFYLSQDTNKIYCKNYSKKL